MSTESDTQIYSKVYDVIGASDEAYVIINCITEASARAEAARVQRLHDAAPEMLAAMQAVLADCGDCDTESRLTLAVGRQLRAAVERATS